MVIARGLCLLGTGGRPLGLFELPENFKWIGIGSIGVIPVAIVIFVITVLVFDFLLRRTTAFRLVYYTGSNEKAAAYSGIRTKRVIFLTTVLCSTLCGVAGIIYMARFGSAQPTFGVGMELNVIAAAVIGGASLSGGKGTIFGRSWRDPAVTGVLVTRPSECVGLLAGHHPRLDPARRRDLRLLPRETSGGRRAVMNELNDDFTSMRQMHAVLVRHFIEGASRPKSPRR